MPPLNCRLSTLGLRVARPWAGVVDGVPHGFMRKYRTFSNFVAFSNENLYIFNE
jgi:hypothetical protein